MTIKEIQEQIVPQWVRVIGSTYNPTDTTRKMIGDEFKVNAWDLEENTVAVFIKDKEDSRLFNRSDVQILTPVVHEGYRIGIGDMVNQRHEVVGWSWHGEEWCLNTVYDNDLDVTDYWEEENITSVTPLYPAKDAEVERAIKLLEDKGICLEKWKLMEIIKSLEVAGKVISR